MNKIQIGKIGESYVLYKLSTFGKNAIKVSDLFEFDLLTNKGIKLEVKTSTKKLMKRVIGKWIYEYYIWTFANTKTEYEKLGKGRWKSTSVGRDRNCDYFVFVCLNKDYSIEKCYIIPKEIIGNNKLISIGTGGEKYKNKRIGKYEEYKEKWELIN